MYVPQWETLSDALARVLATGLDAVQAKRQICAAIADRAILVRVEVARTERDIPGSLRTDRQVKPPPRLQPEDLDWNRSKPLDAWNTGPDRAESYGAMGWGWRQRQIARLELRTDDLIGIFCSTKCNDVGTAAAPEAGSDPPVALSVGAPVPAALQHTKRRHNGLDYRVADAPLVAVMREMITAGTARSPKDAARAVVNRAVGHATDESKVARLAHHYYATHGAQS